MSSQYGELRRTRGWARFVSFGHPSKFQRVSRFCFVIAPTSLNEGQPNFARCLAVSWAGTLYKFWGLLSPNGILSGVKFTVSPSLAFSYIGTWQRYCTTLEQWASVKLFYGVVFSFTRQGGHPVRHWGSNCLVISVIIITIITRNVGQCLTWWSPCRT